MKLHMTLALTIAVSLSAGTALAVGINTWQRDATPDNVVESGDWNVGADWSQAAFPGDTGQTDDDVQLLVNPLGVNSSYTVSATRAMFPGGLTIRSIYGGASFNDGGTTGQDVSAAGDGVGQLVWNIDDGGTAYTSPAILLGDEDDIVLNKVDLSISGDFDSVGSNYAVRWSHSSANDGAGFNATDSNISIVNTGAAAPVFTYSEDKRLIMVGQATGAATPTSSLTMSDGVLSMAGNSWGASFTNTLLDIGTMQPSSTDGFEVTIDNSGIDATSVIGSLQPTGTHTTRFQGGNFRFGTVDFRPATNSSPTVIIDGATVDIADAGLNPMDIQMGVTGSDPNGGTWVFQVNAGSVTARNALVGNKDPHTKGQFTVEVSGGSLTLSGDLMLGRNFGGDPVVGSYGSGTFIQSGGTFEADDVIVGQQGDGTGYRSSGFYDQSGGVATVNGTFTLNPGSLVQPAEGGAREFTVSGSAVLRMEGDGFDTSVASPGANWTHLTTWDASGTIVFDPDSPTTQGLLAFGDDLGKTSAGLTASNFSHGTIDISGLNLAGEILEVVGAGNFATNALYVDAILGALEATVTDHLQSAINIYYNGSSSPGLNFQTYDLVGGGQLISLQAPIPEPSSALLLAGLVLGGTTWLRRRGRRHFGRVE